MKPKNNVLTKYMLAIALILSGCASTPKEPPTPSRLCSITLNSSVTIVEQPKFKTGADELEFVATTLGATGPQERAKEFQRLMADQVDVQRMVIESVKRRFAEAGLPITVVATNGEADLRFSVETYGLRFAFEGRKVPVMDLRATLVDSSGKVIWDDKESIDPKDQFTDGVNTRSWSQYQQSPALLKADFSSIIDILVKELIDKLSEDHASGDMEY